MTDSSPLIQAGGPPVMGPDESLALLRRFEPVIHHTRGELFLPMAAEDYKARSARAQGSGLWRRRRLRETVHDQEAFASR